MLLSNNRRPVPGEVRGVNQGDTLAMPPNRSGNARGLLSPQDIADAKAKAQPIERRIMGLLAGAEVKPNELTGGEQKLGEQVTLPRVWHSDKDHPVAMLAYITPTEANILSKLDVHGSGVDQEAHFGPGGIQSFQGGGGTGDGSGGGGGDGYGGKDEGDRAREAAGAAAPGAGPFGGMGGQQEGGKDEGTRARDAMRAGGIGAFPDSRTLGDRIGDWFGRQATNVGIAARTALNNPISTIANFAVPGIPGLLNMGVGAVTGKSLTDRAIAGIADLTNYGGNSNKSTGAIGESGPTGMGDPNSGTEGYTMGTGSQNPYLLSAAQQNQMPGAIAQQALRQNMITAPPPNYWTGNAFSIGTNAGRPAAYNWWTGNQFNYPTGLLG